MTSVSAYLRHPLTLLAAVALTIGFVWYVLGLPVDMPPNPLSPGEKLACVSYAPESTVSPSASVPVERIEADLAALAPHTDCVRTYRTGWGMDRVPEVAARLGLTVLQGVALGRDAAENRSEIERAVEISASAGTAIRAYVVGTEILGGRILKASELAAIVGEVRKRTESLVTSSEQAEGWTDADLLVGAVDFITLYVPLYEAAFPPAASGAAERIVETRRFVAEQFPDRPIAVVEAGWPGEGRMRGAALPSPANQALVLHRLVAAAKREKFHVSAIEGFDVARSGEGTAASHWGLLHSDGQRKFQWGGRVVSFPLWSMQAAMGILFALIVFAAGFFSARSAGPEMPAKVRWEPVAFIALGGGAFIGWTVADLPLHNHAAEDWLLSSLLVALALAVPPLCAAAVVRAVPFEGFGAILDPYMRRAAHPLGRVVAALFALTALAGIVIGLLFSFDGPLRDIPFAPLTGPATAIFVLAATNPRGARPEGIAELGAAIVLAACAGAILFNESFWNWQALWLAAALAALALACRMAGAQRRG